MVTYKNGKIYKIYCDENDDCYVGSTKEKYLCNRFNAHKQQYKLWKKGELGLCNSYLIFEKYGIDNCKCILIEKYPCDSKDELRMREEYWRKELNSNNKKRAFATKEDKLKDKKNEHIRNKEYYDNYNKKYRINNIKKLKEKQCEKILCEVCNCKISRSNLAIHKKMKKHIKNLQR
ncbi:MAG TPA: GIY-YIG nuclease family protein [Candidatus Sulfopaludibacter sp.]|nr:GIY-YIG nuclease family protein [Candidatus Sulfopaludibacter sp.]